MAGGRLRLAPAFLLAALGAAPATGAARIARLPLADGLRAADVVVVARVVRAEREADGERVEVTAASGLPGRASLADSHFRAGERLLALLTREPDGLVLLPPPQRGSVALGEREPGLEAIRQVVGGYLDSLRRDDAAPGADPGAARAFLVAHVSVADPRLRTLVLGDLAGHVGPDDLPWLAGLLADPERPVQTRRWAVSQVAALDPDAFPETLAALLDPEVDVELRRAAVRAYVGRKQPHDLPALARALRDPDRAVRLSAVQALGSPDAVPLLRDRLAVESDLPVQLAIVRRLGVIATPEARTVLESILADARDPQLAKATRQSLRQAERLAR